MLPGAGAELLHASRTEEQASLLLRCGSAPNSRVLINLLAVPGAHGAVCELIVADVIAIGAPGAQEEHFWSAGCARSAPQPRDLGDLKGSALTRINDCEISGLPLDDIYRRLFGCKESPENSRGRELRDHSGDSGTLSRESIDSGSLTCGSTSVSSCSGSSCDNFMQMTPDSSAPWPSAQDYVSSGNSVARLCFTLPATEKAPAPRPTLPRKSSDASCASTTSHSSQNFENQPVGCDRGNPPSRDDSTGRAEHEREPVVAGDSPVVKKATAKSEILLEYHVTAACTSSDQSDCTSVQRSKASTSPGGWSPEAFSCSPSPSAPSPSTASSSTFDAQRGSLNYKRWQTRGTDCTDDTADSFSDGDEAPPQAGNGEAASAVAWCPGKLEMTSDLSLPNIETFARAQNFAGADFHVTAHPLSQASSQRAIPGGAEPEARIMGARRPVSFPHSPPTFCPFDSDRIPGMPWAGDGREGARVDTRLGSTSGCQRGGTAVECVPECSDCSHSCGGALEDSVDSQILCRSLLQMRHSRQERQSALGRRSKALKKSLQEHYSMLVEASRNATPVSSVSSSSSSPPSPHESPCSALSPSESLRRGTDGGELSLSSLRIVPRPLGDSFGAYHEEGDDADAEAVRQAGLHFLSATSAISSDAEVGFQDVLPFLLRSGFSEAHCADIFMEMCGVDYAAAVAAVEVATTTGGDAGKAKEDARMTASPARQMGSAAAEEEARDSPACSSELQRGSEASGAGGTSRARGEGLVVSGVAFSFTKSRIPLSAKKMCTPSGCYDSVSETPPSLRALLRTPMVKSTSAHGGVHHLFKQGAACETPPSLRALLRTPRAIHHPQSTTRRAQLLQAVTGRSRSQLTPRTVPDKRRSVSPQSRLQDAKEGACSGCQDVVKRLSYVCADADTADVPDWPAASLALASISFALLVAAMVLMLLASYGQSSLPNPRADTSFVDQGIGCELPLAHSPHDGQAHTSTVTGSWSKAPEEGRCSEERAAAVDASRRAGFRALSPFPGADECIHLLVPIGIDTGMHDKAATRLNGGGSGGAWDGPTSREMGMEKALEGSKGSEEEIDTPGDTGKTKSADGDPSVDDSVGSDPAASLTRVQSGGQEEGGTGEFAIVHAAEEEAMVMTHEVQLQPCAYLPSHDGEVLGCLAEPLSAVPILYTDSRFFGKGDDPRTCVTNIAWNNCMHARRADRTRRSKGGGRGRSWGSSETDGFEEDNSDVLQCWEELFSSRSRPISGGGASCSTYVRRIQTPGCYEEGPVPLRLPRGSTLSSDTIAELGFIPAGDAECDSAGIVLVSVDPSQTLPLYLGAGEGAQSLASTTGGSLSRCRAEVQMVGVDARGGEHLVQSWALMPSAV